MEDKKWVTSWACAIQGPYPFGTADERRELRYALPSSKLGASDQSFRMAIRPEVLTPVMRIRFSNTVSAKPLSLDNVFVGLQDRGAAVAHGTNTQVRFDGAPGAYIPPGQSLWSDPITLSFAAKFAEGTPRLLVSFHVVGTSGELGWQSEALNTSYISRPGSGAVSGCENGFDFTEVTTAWFVVDAADALVPSDTKLIVVLGDSITNGTGSTLDGSDRWTDIFSIRLQRLFGKRVAVVNVGIGGNQIIGPREYNLAAPFPGGPPAIQRVDRDVLSLSGISTIIWTQGINDLASGGATPEALVSAMKSVAARLRDALPGVQLLAGTLSSALGSEGPYGSAEVDHERNRFNDLLRASEMFDGIVDFDRATANPTADGLADGLAISDVRPGPHDRLHLDRAGYLTMGSSIDLRQLFTSLPNRLHK